MGKAAKTRKVRQAKFVDPALDQLAVLDARNMLVNNLFSMGWRLALTVLVPIFVGVQIDKKLDSSPSVTLAAFFIAVFGASLLIYRTYSDMTAQQLIADAKKAKRSKKSKRGVNA